MSDRAPLRVVLCWHMHQPIYLDAETNRYRLPWTYLHAIKDYVDMAAIIEQTPGARAVVNFVPTLLEQLDDYARQIAEHLNRGTPVRDRLLDVLAARELPDDRAMRLRLIKACLRANEKRLINRYAPYRFLVDLYRFVDDKDQDACYLSDQFLADILVWYHLAWMGETVRTVDPRIKALMAKASNFDYADRRTLLSVIGEQIKSIIPRYRKLAEAGRIELSVTPYAHPILPLLLDVKAAHEAQPEAPLPAFDNYPGGEERVRWHISEGNRVFKRYFGMQPSGCWPSEGGVSKAAVKLLAEAGYKWVASGESVMRNSLQRSGFHEAGCIHHPYRIEGSDIACFFRDDNLSDSIGFNYAEWHAEDAVSNLVHHLEHIAEACSDEPDRLVPIILDGENAWEYYPENGIHFLGALYKRLAQHPRIELTTFAECVATMHGGEVLPELVAGSWVYGTFSTWIGEAAKNRGWELLVDAKRTFDRVVADGRLSGEVLHEAERQLAICEGSDWFWWFGDYNPSDSVRDFERLYRIQLTRLYRLLGEAEPDSLSEVISHGGGAPAAGGVMRRGSD